jgi:hypothetical protein
MPGVMLMLRQASVTHIEQSPYDLANGRDALEIGSTHAIRTLRGYVEMTACKARGRAPRRGGAIVMLSPPRLSLYRCAEARGEIPPP